MRDFKLEGMGSHTEVCSAACILPVCCITFLHLWPGADSEVFGEGDVILN